METYFCQKTKLCLHTAQLNKAYFLSAYSYSLLNLSFGKEQGKDAIKLFPQILFTYIKSQRCPII